MPKFVKEHLKATAMYPVMRHVTRDEFEALQRRVETLETMRLAA